MSPDSLKGLHEVMPGNHLAQACRCEWILSQVVASVRSLLEPFGGVVGGVIGG